MWKAEVVTRLAEVLGFVTGMNDMLAVLINRNTSNLPARKQECWKWPK